MELEAALLSPTTIPLDRACVLVRAPLHAVLQALAPFAGGEPAIDVQSSLERGIGLDETLPAYARAVGRRAVVYKPRGASFVGIIREGEPGEVHDAPLARRLSRVLQAPAVALHAAAQDGAFALFHEGRTLESWLCASGEVVTAQTDFVLDEAALAADPYGRALALLAAYGFSDDRLVFDDFARGDVILRRWDTTIARAYGFADLAAWPVETLALAA